MFAEVDHPGLGLLMDPTNYFEDHNIDQMDAVLNQMFDTLAGQDQDRHAKDVKRAEADKSEKHADIGDEDALESHTFRGVGEIELPAPGLGSLNYDLYLQRLAEKHPNIPIIIEHLEEDDVPRAKKFLDGKAARERALSAMVALYGRSDDAARGPRACRDAVAVRRRAADDARRRRRARHPHARIPHRHRPALHRAGRPRARHRRLRVSRARRSAGTRRPASAIRGCTSTKARAVSPGCARSPACWSPAGSTTSCSWTRSDAAHYHYGPRKTVDSSLHGRVAPSRPASSAMASAGTATSARSGARAWCSRPRCSARTCT